MDVKQFIRKRYPRKFKFRYKGKMVAEGEIEPDDVILLEQQGRRGTYLKGVERAEFGGKDRYEFRYMYWANLGGKWRWGQSCVCIPTDLMKQLQREMKNAGWI